MSILNVLAYFGVIKSSANRNDLCYIGQNYSLHKLLISSTVLHIFQSDCFPFIVLMTDFGAGHLTVRDLSRMLDVHTDIQSTFMETEFYVWTWYLTIGCRKRERQPNIYAIKLPVSTFMLP